MTETKSGGVHPTLWSASRGFGNAGVKLATKSTYTLFFGSYHRAFERDFVGGGSRSAAASAAQRNAVTACEA